MSLTMNTPELSENLRRIAAEMEDDDLQNPSDPGYAKLLEDEDVVFCLESSGMACGPCGMTVAFGIRFPGAEWPSSSHWRDPGGHRPGPASIHPSQLGFFQNRAGNF